MVNNKIVEIKEGNKVLAIYIPAGINTEGVTFVTPESYPLQIGILNHKQGKLVPAHAHPHLDYNILNTQEYLYLASGEMTVKIFNLDWQEKEMLKMTTGDSILFVDCGHEVDMKPGSKVVEVKQGPYPGLEKSKIYKDTNTHLPPGN